MKVKIKTSWSEITIKEYIQLQDAEDDMDLLSILTDIESLDDITLFELEQIKKDFDFIYTEPKSDYKEKYIVNEITYNAITNPKYITASQYIDLQTFIKEPIKNIANILAIMWIPEGCKYNEGYDIQKNALVFEQNVSIEDAYSFFLYYNLLSMLLQNHLVDSSIQKLEGMIQEEQNLEERIRIFKTIHSIQDGAESTLQNR